MAGRTNGPLVQRAISRDGIVAMLERSPRRYRILDKDPLRAPSKPGGDHRLNFRFRETFQNLLRECPATCRTLHDGFNDEIYAYLACDDAGIVAVRQWLNGIQHLVVCRDLLAMSIALDFDRVDGDPEQPHTTAALLRKNAKPYDRPASDDHRAAAALLASQMTATIDQLAAYRDLDAVIAMPSSSATKTYDLPRVLASAIARHLGCGDASDHVRTVGTRPQTKHLTVTEKLGAIDGSIAIDEPAVAGRTIVLVDDLYQSGISMNYVAMELQRAGARAILGLAAEKTCRNDHNLPRS